MSTYTISGKDLQELPKSMLYQHFSRFGSMSDHIVRNKGPSFRSDECSEMSHPAASFTIAYRSLSKPESDLLDKTHQIGGVQVTCTKQETSSSISDRKVFIKYLDKRATAKDIEDSLSTFGPIEHVHVSMKKDKSMNLGLCNVLFRTQGSVKKILNEENIFIKSKKVKVEPYKCHNTTINIHGPYETSPSHFDLRQAQKGQNWSAPQLQDKSEIRVAFSPYSDRLKSLKTPKSVFDMPFMGSEIDLDIKSKFPPLKTLPIQGASKMTLTRATGDSRDQFEVQSKNGDAGQPTNQIQSLDFSLIEEECEDSPRPRRNSQNLQQTYRVFEERKNLDCVQDNAIISIHGDLPAEAREYKPVEKDSFHSVRPTSRKYYNNPRHHLLGLLRNHNEKNLSFKKTSSFRASPLPEAAIRVRYTLF